jgi:hypothetical protein
VKRRKIVGEAVSPLPYSLPIISILSLTHTSAHFTSSILISTILPLQLGRAERHKSLADRPVLHRSVITWSPVAIMVPKHPLEIPPSVSPTLKRAHTMISPIVKPSYRAHFDKLCALHNWTPSAAVRDKLARLFQLSGNRLQASELLPLAFSQHYPFIWMKDFLLLGYNDANDSVWYKAFSSGRGMARGRYYNSSQVNILGKHTLAKFWQSWAGVFDIEQRGLNRSHEYFTGVYLVLQKFPNLRYCCSRRGGNPRDPRDATRVTGVVEFPFNDDHPFTQETSGGSNDINLKPDENVVSDTHEDQDDARIIKREQRSSHSNEDSSKLTSRQSSTQPILDPVQPEQIPLSHSSPSRYTVN